MFIFFGGFKSGLSGLISTVVYLSFLFHSITLYVYEPHSNFFYFIYKLSVIVIIVHKTVKKNMKELQSSYI